jgi:hypothetical protein
VPKSFGGPLNRDNIVLACSACNNERGTMDAQVFRALKAGQQGLRVNPGEAEMITIEGRVNLDELTMAVVGSLAGGP